MAHFAFISPPLAGHVHALSALALELIGRGHRATFVGVADTGRWLSDERIGLHVIGRDTHPAGAIEADAKRMARLRGLLGVRPMIRDLARLADTICDEAPRALDFMGADIVICDQMEPAGALAAEVAGLPLVTVAAALHVNAEPDVPPPFVGWSYDPSEHGRWKVRGAYRVSDWLMMPVRDVMERHCRANGFRVRRDYRDWVSGTLDLLQAVPSLDYPRHALPSATHYVGPLRTREKQPLNWLDELGVDRPLAFCSLGTLQGSRASLLRTIGRAAVECDLDVVLVHCGRLSARDIATLPARVVVRDFVPQRVVLERADLAIVHGGFNTVLDAVAAETPLVILPLAFEQPAIAARAERAGLARVVSPHFATRRRVRRAIDDVLGTKTMRARAGEVAREIAAHGGAPRAADLVERTVLQHRQNAAVS